MTSSGGPALTWDQARASPCLSCPESYCCTHPVVHRQLLRSLVDVDYAQYLLNFDGIVLGIDEEFALTVYAVQACRHLDAGRGLCGVHGTDEQPAECRTYPAFACTYRRRMAAGNDPQHPLVDRARFDWLAERLWFDDNRALVGGPEWPDIVAAFSAIPLAPTSLPPSPPDPALAGWRQVALGVRPEESGRSVFWDDPALADPCSACAAWCCEVLSFPQPVPSSVGEMEHLRYLLGFPSVSLAVADGDWRVLVRSRCRHLAGGRCSVYGQDARPLYCGAYQAVGCRIRPTVTAVDPDREIRVDGDTFPALERAIAYDRAGAVARVPPVRELASLLTGAATGPLS